MITLLALLSWTLLSVSCPITTGHQRLWYYIVWEYNVYVCDNLRSKEYSRDYIIAHELWHLFDHMYLKRKNKSKAERERFAHAFAKLRNNKYLIKYILNNK